MGCGIKYCRDLLRYLSYSRLDLFNMVVLLIAKLLPRRLWDRVVQTRVVARLARVQARAASERGERGTEGGLPSREVKQPELVKE
jgi:hypothetical protein